MPSDEPRDPTEKSGQPPVRREVSTAGTASPPDDVFKAAPTLATAAEVPVDEGPFGLPRWVGRYRLGPLLGRGGMGAVYEAEQESPRRKVALKILRPSMAAETALDRFNREVAVLAQLQHAGIATIFDAGTQRLELGEAVAYFAMEHVPAAMTIEQYASSGGLSVSERLALFARVCDAIEYAHTRGVIHRDIKPGNVLVDAAGNPKVIDFGIAMLKRTDGTPQERYTAAGFAVGTREYMSPEQACGTGGEVDHRTDVYSLGVLLYELVSGSPPFDFKDKGDLEILKILREQEPRPPEERAPGLPGDVSTIVLRAMAKARDRRYATAADLASDVRRFLADEPIEARKDSPTYMIRRRVERAAGRHPVVWAAVAVVFGSVLAFYPAVSLVYHWTPLDRWWGNFVAMVAPAGELTPPRHTVLIGIQTATNGTELGTELGIEGVSERLGPSWRLLHARLLSRFAALAHPPRVVALDFELPRRELPRSEEYDTQLANAIGACIDRGVPIILASSRWDWADRSRSEVVSDVIYHSRLRVGTATGSPEIRSRGELVIDLLVAKSPADWRRSLAVEAALAYRNPSRLLNVTADDAGIHAVWESEGGPAAGDRESWKAAETLEVRLSPDDATAADPDFGLEEGDQRWCFETTVPSREVLGAVTRSYGEAMRASDADLESWFGGKAVLIGDLTGVDARLHRVTENSNEHGAFGQLVAIEGLIRGVGLRRPTVQESWWIVLATVGAGAVLGGGFWSRWRVIVVGMVTLTCVLGLVSVWCAGSSGYVFNPVVPLAGAIVAGMAAAWVRAMHSKIAATAI